MGDQKLLRRVALINIVVPILLIIGLIVELMGVGYSIIINIWGGLLFLIANTILVVFVFARKQRETYALTIYSATISLLAFVAYSQFHALQFSIMVYFLLFLIGLYYLWKK